MYVYLSVFSITVRISVCICLSHSPDDLSASDIGNNESTGGTVLVKVPLSSVQRERSISAISCTSKGTCTCTCTL